VIGIDLFSGAGGLSAGAVATGVRISVAVESDPNAAAAYRANHPEVNLIVEDICDVPDLHPIETSQPTVLFGGPPCQGFSTSNQRTRSLNNPLNHLYTHFIRQVRSMRPTFILFENVKGFVETQGGFFFSDTLRQLEKLGYKVTHGVLNATDYGVPQNRSRLFIVGSLTHSPKLPPPCVAVPTTVSDALLDLPELHNGAALNEMPYRTNPQSRYAQRLRAGSQLCKNNLVTRNAGYIIERFEHVPQGGNWRDIPDSLMSNYTDHSRCHEGIYHRLSWDGPSIVIGNYRKNMLIHPSANRGLSVREAARLQSFSDSHVFAGSIGFQQQQVANAVPPMLAQAVFKHLR